ncbi:MAG: hypothetical protein FJY60_10830 [Betaproteobacteria bacterium]|nr:hypothetical protein [Betaproteobacteria bacterium]
MPAATHATPPLPGLSPVARKPIIARLDGSAISSDVGLLALREMEECLGIARRFANCIDHPRAPARIQHSLADVLRFHLLLIAAANEVGTRVVALKTASCCTRQAPIRTRPSYGSRSSAGPASPVDQ